MMITTTLATAECEHVVIARYFYLYDLFRSHVISRWKSWNAGSEEPGPNL